MPDRENLRDAFRDWTALDTSQVSDATVNTWLNEGERAVGASFTWPFLEESNTFNCDATGGTTIVGTVLQATHYLQQINDVVPTGERTRLVRTTFQEVMNQYGDDIPEAEFGTAYYVREGKLWIVPTPPNGTTGYTIRYLRTVTVMAGDTDTPEWAEPFHLLPAQYAAWRGWGREENPEAALEFRDEFYAGIEQMAQWYLGITEQSPLVYGEPHAIATGRPNNMPFLDGV